MSSKFSKHFKKYKDIINFVPMGFHGKKVIYMKPGRSAGTSIVKTLEEYINKHSSDCWFYGQQSKQKPEWLEEITDEEVRDDYFIFSFVRNPFSRVLACWGDGYRFGVSKDFNKHVKEELWMSDRLEDVNLKRWHGWWNPHYFASKFYSEFDDGEIFLDWFGKVENINYDWKHLCQEIGIPHLNLSHIRSGGRTWVMEEGKDVYIKKKEDYKDYYTDETREIVERVYKRDLEYFNYVF